MTREKVVEGMHAHIHTIGALCVVAAVSGVFRTVTQTQ